MPLHEEKHPLPWEFSKNDEKLFLNLVYKKLGAIFLSLMESSSIEQ